MRRQRRQLHRAPTGSLVIEQHAHAHAAIGRLQQRLLDQLAGVVVFEDEVLDVQRALGLLRHLHAQQEAVDADR